MRKRANRAACERQLLTGPYCSLLTAYLLTGPYCSGGPMAGMQEVDGAVGVSHVLRPVRGEEKGAQKKM
eukprot:756639-Pyramimonas_sp.AAC.1